MSFNIGNLLRLPSSTAITGAMGTTATSTSAVSAASGHVPPSVVNTRAGSGADSTPWITATHKNVQVTICDSQDSQLPGPSRPYLSLIFRPSGPQHV